MSIGSVRISYHVGVSFTPRFDAGELGEWFRVWITARATVTLESRKGGGRKTSAETFRAFLLWFLGEMMKSARVFAVAVLCALMFGTLAGTAAAETGGADTPASSSILPGDGSG
ncbi:hypothetical protein [Streptomyces sp. NPDC058735]|uniref:hypothetical protein n=1 Tax=unclassified Streptomyces TaxID=2593676 RepID=UPI0036CF51C9